MVISGEAVEVNTKNPLWKPIPIEGKLRMTFFIQEKGEFMLRSQNFENLVLKSLELGNEELKNLLLRLSTKVDPLSFLDVFYLEQGEKDPNGQNSAYVLH